MPDLDDLLAMARTAAERSYSPYSHFRVGAAIQVADTVHTGANVENASYGLTVCAERNAAFQAVLAGARRFDAVAVACVDAPDDAPPSSLMPCGACLQVLAEFCPPETPILVDRVGSFRLADLLPHAFRLPDR